MYYLINNSIPADTQQEIIIKISSSKPLVLPQTTNGISVNIMSDRSNPDPFVITKSRTMNKRVKLNVGGIRHEIMWKILETVPSSRSDKPRKLFDFKVFIKVILSI